MKPHYRWSWDLNKPVLVFTINRFGSIIVQPSETFRFPNQLSITTGSIGIESADYPSKPH